MTPKTPLLSPNSPVLPQATEAPFCDVSSAIGLLVPIAGGEAGGSWPLCRDGRSLWLPGQRTGRETAGRMQARRFLLTGQVWLCNMVTSQCPRSLQSGAEDLAPLRVSWVRGMSHLPQPVLASPEFGKGSCLPSQASCLSLGWRKGSCAGPGSEQQGHRQPASTIGSVSPCREQGEQRPCLSFSMHQAGGMERGLPCAGLLAHPEAASG